MKKISEILTIKLFDIAPTFENYSIDKILAMATASTRRFENLENLLKFVSEEEVENIHKKATRRGHASITTLPYLYISFDGSRVLDYFLTSIKYTRALVFSTRGKKYGEDDILIPDGVYDSGFKSDYENVLGRQLDFYSSVIEKGVPIEQARKVLGLGFPSHGFLSLSLDTATEISKMGGTYLPSEIEAVGEKIGEFLKEKTGLLYKNKLRLKISTLYPFPNLFKDPDFSPDYSKYLEEPAILNCSIDPSFWKLNFKDFCELSDSSVGKVSVRYVKPMSLAVFNEEKRHGSVEMEVESIHLAAERALENPKGVSIPPQLKGYADNYLEIVKDSLLLYMEMIKSGVKFGDAAYVIPQGVKVVVLGNLNGYHLFHPFGYFSIRSCGKAEEEMRGLTEELIRKLGEIEPRISGFIGPKCKVGYCPEEKYCDKILKYSPSYSQELHKTLQSS